MAVASIFFDTFSPRHPAPFVYLCTSPRNRIKRLCKGPNQSCPAHTLWRLYRVGQAGHTYALVPVHATPQCGRKSAFQILSTTLFPYTAWGRKLSANEKRTRKNSIFNLAISLACSENRCILRGVFGVSPSFRLDPSLRHIILDVFNLSCPSVLAAAAAAAIVRLSRSNFYYDSNNKNKNEKRK